MSYHEEEPYRIEITGISGWTEGEREQAVRDGVAAAARILAARGVDCRGALDFHGDADVEREIGEILAHVAKHGRQAMAVPPPVDIPIPGSDGQRIEDPRMATPEGRLELLKEAAATGEIEFAKPEHGGFVVQYNVSGRTIGFGEFTVVMDKDGIRIDDECMSEEFAEALFEKLISFRKE